MYAVRAGRDIAASIAAGRDVGALNAPRDMIAAVDAGRDVGGVTAGERIGTPSGGAVTAGRDVGDVTTGRGDIAAAVTATAGSIGRVSAGTEGGGRVTGNLTAGTTVAAVTAYGSAGVAGTRVGGYQSLAMPDHGVGASEGLYNSPWQTTDAENDVYVALALPGQRPDRATYLAGGDISGAVRAGGDIGPVVAVGKLSGAVTSTGGSVGYLRAVTPSYPSAFGFWGGVWAYGAISGPIRSAAGSMAVRTWDRVEESATLTAAGSLEVYAYAAVAGDLKSSAESVTAGSWGDVVGGVEAYKLADVRSYRNVGLALPAGDGAGADPAAGAAGGKTIKSVTGAVRVWAGGKASSSVTAAEYVAVFAEEGVDVPSGGLTSENSDTYVRAERLDIDKPGSMGGSVGGIRAKDLIQLQAGRDIVAVVTSSEGSVVADAGRAINELSGSAKRNVWASARDGSLTASQLTAKEGWFYAWAAIDLKGDLKAKLTVSATAWGNIDAKLTSTNVGVEAWAGGDLKGSVTAEYWAEVEARGTVSATVVAGSDTADADATVRAGGDITGDVTASVEADVAAEGSIRANVRSTRGSTVVVAKGDVQGNVSAELLAEVTAGGSVSGSVVAQEEVNVEGGTGMSARVESVTASVSVWSGADITSSVKAGYEAIVEAVGGISASVTAAYTASVVANGNITGRVEAKWLADVRSATGEVTGQVVTTSTKAERLTNPESPTRRRLAVIDAQLQAMAANPQADPVARQALETEKEIHELGDQSIDFQSVPVARVRAMIADGLAIEENGPPLVSHVDHPFIPDRTQELKGYVIVADIIGTDGYVIILEPTRD